MTKNNMYLKLSMLRTLLKKYVTTEWSKRTPQSLWNYNFATIRHRVMRFLAKCFERNFLHD